MKHQRQVTREISYAPSVQNKAGRVLVRVLENSTGRLKLIKRANGYENDVLAGEDFWSVMVDRYGLDLRLLDGALEAIPKTGPLILVSNHPFGILDGLMMGHILQQVRGDFRILANSVFTKSQDLNRIVLPISFDENKDAVRLNLKTRATALKYLENGGAMGVFPGGTVSTSATHFSKPMDPAWRSFTAKMIAKSGATVVPIYFHGANSRLFQIASHLHTTLRLGLLIHEFKTKIDAPVEVSIGAPISPERLAEFGGASKDLMDFLRKETYDLSPLSNNSCEYGYEFEEKHRRPEQGQKRSKG